MTHDDIIRMAKEAGFNQILATTTGADVWIDDGFYVEELENFAVLVAAAEREKVAAWMHFNDYTTGHGDTTEDLLEEIQAQVAENERWKCAEIAEAYEPRCDVCPKGVAAAIRARGEA